MLSLECASVSSSRRLSAVAAKVRVCNQHTLRSKKENHIRGRASSGFRGHRTAAWTAARTAYMQFLDLMLARARRRAAPCIRSRPCDAGRVCTTAWGRQSQPGTATVCACGPSRDYLPKGVAKATLAQRNWRGAPPADDVSRKICEISGCFFRQKEGEEFHRKPLPSILLAFIRRSSLRKSFLFLTVLDWLW